MKVTFANIFNLDESAIGIPFMIENKPIGTITEVNKEIFTCEIWDKYCGYEFLKDFKNGKIISFYLSSKEQENLFIKDMKIGNEEIKIVSDKPIKICEET